MASPLHLIFPPLTWIPQDVAASLIACLNFKTGIERPHIHGLALCIATKWVTCSSRDTVALKKGQDKAELMPSSCRYQGFLFHISAEGTQLVPLSWERIHISKKTKKKKKKKNPGGIKSEGMEWRRKEPSPLRSNYHTRYGPPVLMHIFRCGTSLYPKLTGQKGELQSM